MEQITPSTVYWISRLDNIAILFNVLSVLLGIATVVLTIAGNIEASIDRQYRREPNGTAKALLKWAKCLGAAALLCGLGCVFTPTTKEACAMIVLPKIAQNEQIQGLGADVVTLAHEWLLHLRPVAPAAK